LLLVVAEAVAVAAVAAAVAESSLAELCPLPLAQPIQ
jgi:hypothetical protein